MPPEPQTKGAVRLTRRGALALTAGAALVGAFIMPRSTREWVRSILVNHFGAQIAYAEAADRYLAAMTARLDAPGQRGGLRATIKREVAARLPFDDWRTDVESEVITEFLKRTNVYRVLRGADKELVFVSLDPYEAGCGNFLAAPFKPDRKG